MSLMCYESDKICRNEKKDLSSDLRKSSVEKRVYIWEEAIHFIIWYLQSPRIEHLPTTCLKINKSNSNLCVH